VVTSGLNEGDRVVIEGPTDLKDGDPVKVQG
jgi:multidrug efflux pump subunit AcrA (membrane-fusion protein)